MSVKKHQKNNVAIVTGAARGIGRAISLKLAASGYAVVLNDLIDSAELQNLCREINDNNQTTFEQAAISVVGDVGDLSFHKRLVNQAVTVFGHVNALVNNAGVSVKNRGDMLDVSEESFDRCFRVNTKGVFFLTQEVAKSMIKQQELFDKEQLQASIVFITSSNAVAVAETRSEYCASKAGAAMIAQNYAVRLARESIAVYDLQPGLIETAMTKVSKPRYEQQLEQGLVPNYRWGHPEEIAQTVLTCLDGGLPYTVGQVIRNDGGLTISKF